MKKAQGAMEYLMTYGWAILVVMVVGIVMWQLGIFNLGGSIATTSSGFSAVKPQLASITLKEVGTGGFEGIFTNGAGTGISVTALEMTDTTAGLSCGTLTVDNTNPALTAVPISGGDNFIVKATSGCTGGTVGSPAVFSVELTYDLTIGGQTVSKKSSGTVRGPYE